MLQLNISSRPQFPTLIKKVANSSGYTAVRQAVSDRFPDRVIVSHGFLGEIS